MGFEGSSTLNSKIYPFRLAATKKKITSRQPASIQETLPQVKH
jgi:hypothetical protein